MRRRIVGEVCVGYNLCFQQIESIFDYVFKHTQQTQLDRKTCVRSPAFAPKAMFAATLMLNFWAYAAFQAGAVASSSFKSY